MLYVLIGLIVLSRYYKSSVENTYTRALPSSDAPKSAPLRRFELTARTIYSPSCPLVMVPKAPTRKRERGEAPEDYARRDAFKAARGTRERLQSAPTVGIMAHYFSVVYYALINVTRDLALKPIYTNAPRVYVFGPNAASDEQLRSRIELYDRGVDPELFVNLRTPLCWIPFNEQYLVCPSVGEVMTISSSQLVGSIHENKLRITTKFRKNYYRSHMLLLACGKERPLGFTSDHIDFQYPLNDSINNLRWANYSRQAFNRRPQVRRAETTTHSVTLSRHPVLGVFLSCNGAWSRDGGHWTQRPERVSNARFEVFIDGHSYLAHRLMLECLIGRQLEPDEQGDHIDGVTSPVLSNLQILTAQANTDKASVRLCTSVAKDGIAVVWGGVTIGSRELGVGQSECTHSVRGRQPTAGGYIWRDSTVEEVEHFFRAMEAVEDLPAAVASLSAHPRHGELVRALELRREREAALDRLGLCAPPAGWVRETDHTSGLGYYRKEATGECAWRNPTLTRLGL